MDHDGQVILALVLLVVVLTICLIAMGSVNDKLRVKIDYAKEFTGCEVKE